MARIVNAFALTALLATESEARRKGHDQCIKQLECWLTILLVLGAVALAAGYYSYCVYWKGSMMDRKLYDPTRGWSRPNNDRPAETEPLMPVAAATPMT